LDFTIRKAEQKDIPDLRQLLAELSGHELTQSDVQNRLSMVEASPIDELYVFEQENQVRGILGFRIRENIEEPSRYGEISALITKPEARMLGIGRALMEFAEARAKELGCKGTWLVSGFGPEEEAHRFYTRLGYNITGYRFVKPA
jgi:N-acetylglutamate synthase-like GNAT family acetyltransferase